MTTSQTFLMLYGFFVVAHSARTLKENPSTAYENETLALRLAKALSVVAALIAAAFGF